MANVQVLHFIIISIIEEENITPRSTLLWSGSICEGSIYGSKELLNHLLYLNAFNCVQTNDWC